MNRDALDTVIVTALVITRRARPHVEQLRLLYAVKRREKKKKEKKKERYTQSRRVHKSRSDTNVLILPEGALRRCYYPLFPDDSTAAEMLDLVTEKRSIVLQRNLGREATIL